MDWFLYDRDLLHEGVNGTFQGWRNYLTKIESNDFLIAAVVQPLLWNFSLNWFLKMML